MKQLFSADDSLPPYKVAKCQKQVGAHDCGLFAIANAVEILTNHHVENVIFDQTKMRNHLVTCFEEGKLTPFPKYGTTPNKENRKERLADDSDWKIPRRSQRIKKMDAGKSEDLELNNRFETFNCSKSVESQKKPS